MIQTRKLKHLKNFWYKAGFGGDDTLIEDRLLRIVSFLASFLLVPIIISNYILELPDELNYLLIGMSIFYGGIYFYTRKNVITTPIKVAFFSIAYLSMFPLWFLNGGMMGSIYPFYFVVFFMGSVIFEAKHQIAFVVTLLVHLALLLVLEYAFPEWLFEYESLEYKKADMITTMFIAFVALSALLVTFRLSYDRDRNQLLRTQKVLDESNAKLKEANDLAQNASRAKSSFLAQMSHELRTPLNTITGAVDLLNYSDLTDEQKELLKMMNESSSILLNIISDILDLSKVEASKVEIIEEPCDFMDILNNMQHFGHFKISEMHKDIAFHLIVGEDVPKYLKLDEVRVRQIITNLISNAVKYTPEGHITLKVNAIKQGEKSFVKIAVHDTGIGIEDELIERVKQPFYQINKLRDKKNNGVGLGLAICQALIGLMKGSLEVVSQIGKGSEFIVFLPLKPASVKEVKKNFLPIPNEASVLENTRLLLVEDNSVNQFIITKILQTFGITPDIAENGIQAIEAIKEKPFDIVLMDIQMSVMNGLEAARAIMSDEDIYPKPHIIAITANALKEDERMCREAGMHDFISKPISSDKLKDRIRHGLGVLSTRIV